MTSPLDLNASTATPKSSKKLPFTSSERELISALVRERPVIEDKRTNAKNIELKKQAWENLAVAFNAQPYVFPRNSIQLKRCWENIKTQRKKDMSQESLYMTGTGGGPSLGSSTTCSDNIVDIICPFINLKVPGVIDSNTIEISDDLISTDHQIKISNETYLQKTDVIDPGLVEIKENKKRNLDSKVVIDNSNYTRDGSNENFEENVAFQAKRKCLETSSVGNNKLSSEVKVRIKRSYLNIQQDQELHNLRIEREKLLIEREKLVIERERNLLKYENEMHVLNKEKLVLEIKNLK